MKPSAPLWVQKWRGSGRLGPQGEHSGPHQCPFPEVGPSITAWSPCPSLLSGETLRLGVQWKGESAPCGPPGLIPPAEARALCSSKLKCTGTVACAVWGSVCGGWNSLRPCGEPQFWGSGLGILLLPHIYTMSPDPAFTRKKAGILNSIWLTFCLFVGLELSLGDLGWFIC